MRPLAGDDAFGRPRAAAESETPSMFGLPQGPQMTYFFADETTVGSSPQPSPTALHRSKESSSSSNSSCSKIPRNPANTANPAGSDNAAHSLSHYHLDSRDASDTGAAEAATGRPSSFTDLSEPSRHDEDDMSDPSTPPLRPSAVSNMSPGPSGPASALSSISSRRGSFAGSLSEDLGSRAPSVYGSVGIGGSEADKDGEVSASMMDSGSAPQLVMPSIKMPSRRPFTDEGKSMGRLKVLIAGDSGVGKTSLIKAIVQSCEHIVHVDPITPSLSSSIVMRPSTRQRGNSGGGGSSSRRHSSKGGDGGTSQITEIYASTKPYPDWWSEIDDFRVLRRRKSLGDSVLDRNICFVDTPGYGSGSSSMETITPVTNYIEGHFRRMSSNSLTDGDTLNLVGGEGGTQVDVVFYLVSNRLRPVDIQYLRQVTPLTNILLLLAQADLMSPEQIAASKEQVLSQLQEAKIRPFSFETASSSPALFDPARHGLYAISSATGSDYDTMDASLLMSPDYVQPLISTELATLVRCVFSQDGVSWLRHSAARKYVQWRRSENTTKDMSLYHPMNLPNAYPQPSRHQDSNKVLTSPMGATSSYALARITDHTQREERLAQVRLANWASDLQKSIANERAQYAALARGERAIWLTEKLNECVQDGSLVPMPGRARGDSPERIREQVARKWREVAAARGGRGKTASDQAAMQHHDPLGLLEVAADLRTKGLMALEVFGSLGVLGGLVVWASWVKLPSSKANAFRWAWRWNPWLPPLASPSLFSDSFSVSSPQFRSAFYGGLSQVASPNISIPPFPVFFSLISLLGSLQISIFWSPCSWVMLPWSSSVAIAV